MGFVGFIKIIALLKCKKADYSHHHPIDYYPSFSILNYYKKHRLQIMNTASLSALYNSILNYGYDINYKPKTTRLEFLTINNLRKEKNENVVALFGLSSISITMTFLDVKSKKRAVVIREYETEYAIEFYAEVFEFVDFTIIGNENY